MINLTVLIAIYLILSSCDFKADQSISELMNDEKSIDFQLGVALYSFNRFPFTETMETSKEAGAEIVEGFFFHKLGGEFGEKRIPELWDAINEMAEKHGIKLAIHEHARGKSIFWHPDSVLAAIEGHENFGACGDLGHWVRSGLDPVECLKKLEGHLISIHAKDLDEFGNLEANDIKVGTGVIDYRAVMAELKRQKFDGPIYIECEHDCENNLEDVKYAVEYIRQFN